MPKTSRLLATSMVLLAISQAGAQTPLQLAAFNSIEVNTGHIVLRSGPTQRVTLLKGSLEYTRVAVDGDVLVIEKCKDHCPRRYELEVEIQTPSVRSVSLQNGGWIRSQGSFARQTDLTARVAHGGTVDVRSMAVDRVNASVEQGGRILTVPRGSLFARVYQGGAIIYWGNPRVQSSVQHGGVVDKGSAGEINLPLGEVGPALLSPVHHSRLGQPSVR